MTDMTDMIWYKKKQSDGLTYDVPDKVTVTDDKLIQDRMRPWDVKLGAVNAGRKGYGNTGKGISSI